MQELFKYLPTYLYYLTEHIYDTFEENVLYMLIYNLKIYIYIKQKIFTVLKSLKFKIYLHFLLVIVKYDIETLKSYSVWLIILCVIINRYL